MENGLRQSSAYGTLNPGVITSSQHLKWVQRLGESVVMPHFMLRVYFLPGENMRWVDHSRARFSSFIFFFL